jgi:hypothetical protein
MEEKKDVLAKVLEDYENISGRGILEALRNFGFNHESKTFEQACLEKAIEYLEQKEEMTNEEFLAILIRLCVMYFVQVKSSTSIWYLILFGLLPKELQQAKMSEVVKAIENQFVEYMEILGQIKGDEGIKDAVLVFLFKENGDLTSTVFETTNVITETLSKLLH